MSQINYNFCFMPISQEREYTEEEINAAVNYIINYFNGNPLSIFHSRCKFQNEWMECVRVNTHNVHKQVASKLHELYNSDKPYYEPMIFTDNKWFIGPDVDYNTQAYNTLMHKCEGTPLGDYLKRHYILKECC